jgi:HD superfamily phosphodiesterase
MSLAKEEGLAAADMEIVELGALLHDVCDWKYSGP